MPEDEPDKSRTGRVLAIIGAAVAVGTLIVGVLTYLQSQPSSVAEYRHQVSVVCQSAKVRQVPLTSAINAQGRYDRTEFVRYVTSQIAADRTTVEEFRKLRAPSELGTRHAEAVGVGDRWVTAEATYLESLERLPAAEWNKRPPRLPGDSAVMAAMNQQFFGALETLSGGTCVNPDR